MSNKIEEKYGNFAGWKTLSDNTLQGYTKKELIEIINKYSSNFSSLCSKLDSLSPLKVLSRGYSITKKGNSIIKYSKELSVDDIVSIRFTDKDVKAKITEV